MKLPPFTTKTLLLITALVAIAAAGSVSWARMVGQYIPYTQTFQRAYFELEFVAPLFIPIAFVSYLLGRRSISILSVAIFALIELIGLAIASFRLSSGL
jgi:hypothetical protein